MAKITRPASKKAGAPRAPRLTKSQAQKLLAPVPDACVFWCNDGQLLRDMKELAQALANMSDLTFSYHCNETKKDFSKWVREVIGDEPLAQSLEIAASREQAAAVVEQRCSLLIRKAG
jgi:hypothetical protein